VSDQSPTAADIRADARRHFRWWTFLVNIAFVFALFHAIEVLGDGDLSERARFWWIAIPAGLLPLAYWSWARQTRRQDELERAVEGRAAVVAFRLTIFWLFAIALLHAAVGLPLTIPGPFGLPDDQLGWQEVAFVPLFFWIFAWIRERRRVFPKR
jgi:hypothetical protein